MFFLFYHSFPYCDHTKTLYAYKKVSAFIAETFFELLSGSSLRLSCHTLPP